MSGCVAVGVSICGVLVFVRVAVGVSFCGGWLCVCGSECELLWEWGMWLCGSKGH